MTSLPAGPGITLATLMLLAMLPTPAAAQTYTCQSDTDFAVGLRNGVVGVVTGADTAAAIRRQRWALPATTAAAVTFVTDPRACTAAATAYHNILRPQEPPRSRTALVVIQVGDDRFTVADPDDTVPESEFLSLIVFDRAWKRLAHLAI